MNISRVSRFFLTGGLSAVVLALAGCTLFPEPKVDPTRYYVLTGAPLADSGAREARQNTGLVLGLKRIDIVPYLNGKDMVVRMEGNEITYQSFARWAEPLTTSIGRTLAGRLAGSGNVARIHSQPFPFEGSRDYDVSVRVLRCEGEIKDGKAVASFSALVEVVESKPGGALVLRKVFTAPATEWDGKNFGALASALSDSVAALAAEILAALPAK